MACDVKYFIEKNLAAEKPGGLPAHREALWQWGDRLAPFVGQSGHRGYQTVRLQLLEQGQHIRTDFFGGGIRELLRQGRAQVLE